ncbi:MAG: helix-turn-helix transcriptional regulator [Clostridia bacterium]|nr:helix-turn-helix transcriptional regulator [Clostridia bacterium]
MIVYDRLWKTMREKGVSQYRLIREYRISTGQLDRLRKNADISTYTLGRLCEILDCELEDIAEFRKDEDVPTVGDTAI